MTIDEAIINVRRAISTLHDITELLPYLAIDREVTREPLIRMEWILEILEARNSQIESAMREIKTA